MKKMYRSCYVECKVTDKTDPNGRVAYEIVISTNKNIHHIPVLFDPNAPIFDTYDRAAQEMKDIVDQYIDDDAKSIPIPTGIPRMQGGLGGTGTGGAIVPSKLRSPNGGTTAWGEDMKEWTKLIEKQIIAMVGINKKDLK